MVNTFKVQLMIMEVVENLPQFNISLANKYLLLPLFFFFSYLDKLIPKINVNYFVIIPKKNKTAMHSKIF